MPCRGADATWPRAWRRRSPGQSMLPARKRQSITESPKKRFVHCRSRRSVGLYRKLTDRATKSSSTDRNCSRHIANVRPATSRLNAPTTKAPLNSGWPGHRVTTLYGRPCHAIQNSHCSNQPAPGTIATTIAFSSFSLLGF